MTWRDNYDATVGYVGMCVTIIRLPYLHFLMGVIIGISNNHLLRSSLQSTTRLTLEWKKSLHESVPQLHVQRTERQACARNRCSQLSFRSCALAVGPLRLCLCHLTDPWLPLTRSSAGQRADCEAKKTV